MIGLHLFHSGAAQIKEIRLRNTRAVSYEAARDCICEANKKAGLNRIKKRVIHRSFLGNGRSLRDGGDLTDG